jgi:hypothetical protein
MAWVYRTATHNIDVPGSVQPRAGSRRDPGVVPGGRLPGMMEEGFCEPVHRTGPGFVDK